jgi:stage IV sporulation protein B
VLAVAPSWRDAHPWRTGLQVRDRLSGVGTLTFYDPRTMTYAALGHSLTAGVTALPVPVRTGWIRDAEIVGVVPATARTPGQKIGILVGHRNVQGTVQTNGQFGIVGHLDRRPILGPVKPVPLALPDQVHTGPATVVTVIHGQTPHPYQIQILKTAPQYAPQIKGILFQITDPRLLKATGGIVQGMSGSPILQDGRLVGAVTHVLLNRPTLGFGCYAYWMWPAGQERQAS